MPQPKRDAVHRYFTFESSSNSSKCELCGRKLKGKHTSNLKNHLAGKHVDKFNEVLKCNKQISKRKEINSKTDEVIVVEDTLKNLCMRLVTIHGHSFTLINDEPFQKLLNLAASSNIRSKDINAKAIKAMIPDVAHNIKLKIATEVRHKLISLKVDSVACLERKFIGINIQYIKNDKVILRNLNVSEIKENKTSDVVKQEILEVLNVFRITKEQIYSLTTDIGANVMKMSKLIKNENITVNTNDEIDHNEETDVNEEEESDGDTDVENDEKVQTADILDHTLFKSFIYDNDLTFSIRCMSCAAHMLQLAIKDAFLENISAQTTLELARNICKLLCTPTNRNLLKLANLKVPIIDCSTKWTSSCNMLVQLLPLRDFCENFNDIARLLSPVFWSEIENVVNCLRPLNECTLILQKEQLTIGDFFINWMKCKSKIGAAHNSFASSLYKAMESREKTLLETDVVLEALYLDGRLNVILSDEQCQRAKNLLNQTWKQIQMFPDSEQPCSSNTEKSANATLNDDLSTLERILIKTEMARGLTTRPKSSFDACIVELRNSTRLPLNTNIILHWCNKSGVNSDMAMVAKTVLATPATQISVERLFSSLKFIRSSLRSSISPNLLQNILFIQSNKDLLD